VKHTSPRIILVRPSHPGNIGAVARAMKTMGLSELTLVSPKKFPDDEAFALATHAKNILEKAVVVENIVDALEDITYVYATSANNRELELPVFTPKSASEKIVFDTIHNIHQTAILFGPESHGLSNDDLSFVHGLIQIPTSKEYHSLNLASAVQIIVYEIFSAFHEKNELGDIKELHHFYRHLEQMLIKIKFLDPQNPRQLMQKCRGIFNRTHLKQNELQILRGILKAIDAKTD
jgi:tRNA (cytidine32/uridine32-2'-O)-methyltransferase